MAENRADCWVCCGYEAGKSCTSEKRYLPLSPTFFHAAVFCYGGAISAATETQSTGHEAAGAERREVAGIGTTLAP
jgi:hypothetical protein